MNKNLCVLVFCIASASINAQNVNSVIAQAEENVIKNHWERAFNDLRLLLDTEEDNMTYLQKARAYNILGYLSLMFLDPEEAELDLNRALLYHEEAGIPDQKSYANALVNTSMLYLEQVEFDLARDYIKRALKILDEEPDFYIDYLVARTKLARIYEEAGSYTLALSIYNESYDRMVALGNELSPDFADICSHKGRILMLTGNPIEGERFINLSTTIYESLGSQYNVQRAESMEDLALFYERMGRYGDAENLLLEILELKRSIPDEADILIIETLNDLGLMYIELGRYDQAEKMFNEVVEESEENVGTDHPFYATARNNLGTIALNRGDYPKAKLLLQEALQKFESRFGTVHPYYANTLNNLARTERKLGNPRQAEKHYYEVLEIDLRLFGEDHPNYATTLINIGILLSASDREEDAGEYYEKALEIRKKKLGKNHPSYGNALEYLGLHYLALENRAKAELSFRESIQIQLNLVNALFPIMSKEERELFHYQTREKISRYHYVASQLLDENPELIKNIFDFQVKTKTLLFNTLDKVKGMVADSDDEILKAEYEKWLSDKRLIASYYQMGVDQLAELHVNLEQFEVDIERQELALTKSIIAFEEARPHKDLDWRHILAAVRPNESIVEIIRIQEFESLSEGNENIFGFTQNMRYLAVIFNHAQEELTFTFLGNKDLREIDHLTASENPIDGFKAYWKPIMDLTKGAEWIRVVPDGIYRKLNPNQLKVNKKSYVIEEQYVSYLTSVHDLLRQEPMVLNEKILYLDPGNSLADFSEVQEDISNGSGLESLMSDWKTVSYDNHAATEFRLRSTYSPTIIHLACPAFFESQNSFIQDKTTLSAPLFYSGLYLAGVSSSSKDSKNDVPSETTNDGVLTVSEAMNLQFDRTRLVFLSAIDLEGDNLSGSDGFFGLLRALTVAGAQNVITSVNTGQKEKKRELIELFYSRFLETNQIQSSFRYAQLEMKRKYEDPEIWGGFIVTGSGS